MKQYICVKTFVNTNSDTFRFRRFYVGEKINEDTFYMLASIDQQYFKPL